MECHLGKDCNLPIRVIAGTGKGATTQEAELEDVFQAVKYIKDYSFTPKV